MPFCCLGRLTTTALDSVVASIQMGRVDGERWIGQPIIDHERGGITINY